MQSRVPLGPGKFHVVVLVLISCGYDAKPDLFRILLAINISGYTACLHRRFTSVSNLEHPRRRRGSLWGIGRIETAGKTAAKKTWRKT